jgi:hypothetical protein
VSAHLHFVHSVGLSEDELIVGDAELSQVGGDVGDEGGFELSEVDVLFPEVSEDDVGWTIMVKNTDEDLLKGVGLLVVCGYQLACAL